MPLSKITAIAAAVLLTAISATAIAQTLPTIVVDPAIAAMTDDELVTARQDAMKEDGGILRTAAGLVGDDAVAAATELLQNFTNFPALFREGSITPDSHALPIIWEQREHFDAIFEKAQAGATAMLQAAIDEDDLAYGDAVRGLTQVCGECHQTYRGR
jgi:cytochrome c556